MSTKSWNILEASSTEVSMYRFALCTLMLLALAGCMKEGDTLSPSQVTQLERNATKWCSENGVNPKAVVCSNLFYKQGSVCTVEGPQGNIIILRCDPSTSPIKGKCYRYNPQGTTENGQ